MKTVWDTILFLKKKKSKFWVKFGTLEIDISLSLRDLDEQLCDSKLKIGYENF